MKTIVVIYGGLMGSIFSRGLRKTQQQIRQLYKKPGDINTVYLPWYKPFKYKGNYNYIVIGHSLGARRAIKDANENKKVSLCMTLDYVKNVVLQDDLQAKGVAQYLNFFTSDIRACPLRGAHNYEVHVSHIEVDNEPNIRRTLLKNVQSNVERFGSK